MVDGEEQDGINNLSENQGKERRAQAQLLLMQFDQAFDNCAKLLYDNELPQVFLQMKERIRTKMTSDVNPVKSQRKPSILAMVSSKVKSSFPANYRATPPTTKTERSTSMVQGASRKIVPTTTPRQNRPSFYSGASSRRASVSLQRLGDTQKEKLHNRGIKHEKGKRNLDKFIILPDSKYRLTWVSFYGLVSIVCCVCNHALLGCCHDVLDILLRHCCSVSTWVFTRTTQHAS
jgi:hypothetical protein